MNYYVILTIINVYASYCTYAGLETKSGSPRPIETQSEMTPAGMADTVKTFLFITIYSLQPP